MTDFAALYALSRQAVEKKAVGLLLEVDLSASLGRVGSTSESFAPHSRSRSDSLAAPFVHLLEGFILPRAIRKTYSFSKATDLTKRLFEVPGSEYSSWVQVRSSRVCRVSWVSDAFCRIFRLLSKLMMWLLCLHRSALRSCFLLA